MKFLIMIQKLVFGAQFQEGTLLEQSFSKFGIHFILVILLNTYQHTDSWSAQNCSDSLQSSYLPNTKFKIIPCYRFFQLTVNEYYKKSTEIDQNV